MDFYSNMPTQLRIGSYDYQVVVMNPNDPDNTRLFGDMSAAMQRIRIAPGMTPKRLANTFMHEVLHAVNEYFGIDDQSTEEQGVTQGANGLCLFFQNNPAACQWWIKVNAWEDR